MHHLIFWTLIIHLESREHYSDLQAHAVQSFGANITIYALKYEKNWIGPEVWRHEQRFWL